MFFSDYFLRTKFLQGVILPVYVEHIILGHYLGADMSRDSGGSWAPLNIPFLLTSVIFDYLLISLLVYILLTFLTKYGSSTQKLS